MNEIMEKEINVEDKIHEIRKIHVIVDRDLAKIYGVETKQLMQQVRRNIERFPERYMFQMTDEEFREWKSHFVTSNSDKMGLRRPPYCFTEQSLNSIIYEGKIYDAYSVLIDILNEAMNSIIIIDNYANKELFDILREIDKNIIVISKNLDSVLIKKYSSQYSNIRFINNNDFHDRYIILDKKTVYSSGMSFKDIGKKYTFIYKICEDFFVDDLINRVNGIILDENVM